MSQQSLKGLQSIFRLAPYSWIGAICVIVLLLLPIPSDFRGAQNYLPLHTFLEVLAITVSGAIFALCLSTLKLRPSNNIRWLAWMFCAVAILDFSHTISYPGMPDFVTPSGPEKAINFWLAARSYAALGLFLTASALLSDEISKTKYILPLLTITSVAVTHIVFLYMPGIVPRTFTPEDGLTPFKVYFEYVLIIIYLISAYLFASINSSKDSTSIDKRYFADAAILMALSEFMFTLYGDVTDIYNIFGHFLKVAAYALLFRGLFVELVRRPQVGLLYLERERSDVFNALPDTIFELDASGVVKAALHMGAKPLSSKIPIQINSHVALLLGAEWGVRIAHAFDAASEGRAHTLDHPFIVAAENGDYTAYTFTISKLDRFTESAPGWLLLVRDESEREYHKNQAAHLSSAMTNMPFAMAIIDKQWNVSFSNRAYQEAFGVNTEITRILIELDLEEIDVRLKSGKSVNYEISRKDIDNTEIVEQVYFFPLKEESLGYDGAMIVLENITSKKHSEHEIQKLLRFDRLTGLPKEVVLKERVDRPEKSIHLASASPVVLRLNLDGFSRINQAYGRSHGDRMLQHVSERLRSELPDPIMISREEADHFTILALGLSAAEIFDLISKTLEAVKAPLPIGDDIITISTCIGMAKYPNDGKTFEDLCNSADAALRSAKLSGPGNWASFSQALKGEVTRFMDITMHLDQAIKHNEFYLVFQPQMTADGSQCRGVEVLLRWQSMKLGLVSPSEFIPIAENSNRIKIIGAWVFKETLKKIQSLKKNNVPVPVFSINLSPAQVMDIGTVDYFIEMTSEAEVDPSNIELEITEHMLIKDSETILEKLCKLRHAGFKLALDDFGSGQTSIRYLTQYPIQTLKIDKSLVDNILYESHDTLVIQSIIELAHRLDMEVIVEGVEVFEQQDKILELGCDGIQGFYFSKPLMEDDFVKFLNTTTLRASGPQSLLDG